MTNESKRITRARTAGFCMGVGLALRKLDAETKEGRESLVTLGPIIHNPQVLGKYEAMGVRQQNDPDAIAPGATVVIRAHGVPRQIESGLRERGISLVDATCPKVKKAQLLIADQAAEGRRLLLFGEAEHPEVAGLMSYASAGAHVFDSAEALEEMLADELDPEASYFLAAQTTQDRAAFEVVVSLLRERLDPAMPVYETICDATRQRQEEALAIARDVDAMVVVGGYSSGNTRRLVDVAKSRGIPCQHVETADELDLEALAGAGRIGLTAGASTPKEIIDAVEERLATL
jgi:4-hydroxy-3-methylbut-2-enyl diphosphate reductase